MQSIGDHIMTELKHPFQPVYKDDNGTLRFKGNAIVEWLISEGSLNMNAIAKKTFSREDRAHFAQLIGYSVYGWSELGYVNNNDYDTIREIIDNTELSSKDAELEMLRKKIRTLTGLIRDLTCKVFNIAPEDLPN